MLSYSCKKRRENSITLKMVQEAMTNVIMLCFVLQFSASTVKDALQCFKKGNCSYSLDCSHISRDIRCITLFEAL
eukprot:453158-Pelagomonas_calceolata.AAC.1